MSVTPPLPRLDAELAASSPLAARLVFVAATRRTGAERLVGALARLPGIAAAPAPTHVFEQGIARLFTRWAIAADTTRPQGISRLTEEAEFALAARLLVDSALAPVRPAEEPGLVVEYSPGNCRFAHLIAALYPDATIVHLVADGRRVAARLSLGRYSLAPVAAAVSWCDDQRAVLSCDHQRVLRLRAEDLAADPKRQLELLAGHLGAPEGAVVDEAVTELAGLHPLPVDPPGARAAAIVEEIGSDLLEHLGYVVGATGSLGRGLAKAELQLQTARQLARSLAAGAKDATSSYRHHRRRLAQELSRN